MPALNDVALNGCVSLVLPRGILPDDGRRLRSSEFESENWSFSPIATVSRSRLHMLPDDIFLLLRNPLPDDTSVRRLLAQRHPAESPPQPTPTKPATGLEISYTQGWRSGPLALARGARPRGRAGVRTADRGAPRGPAGPFPFWQDGKTIAPQGRKRASRILY